ncbi:hypothetical protein D3C86_1672030 [compost metagenome]
MLLPLFGLGLLLSWFLAFSKTFEAVKLHGKLNAGLDQRKDLSFNPVYIQRKQAALDQLLNGYRVGEDWNDQLWMKVSEIAAKRNVSIDYTATKPPIEKDSATIGMTQSLYFYGNYVQLVRLIDTLESVSKIGKISGLQLKAPNPEILNERAGKNVLRLDFKGLDKSKDTL